MLATLFFMMNFAFAQSPLEGVETGRYEIHHEASLAAVVLKHAKKTRKPSSEDAETKVAVEQKAEAEIKVQAPALVVDNSEEKLEPSLSEQGRELLNGKVDKIYEFYQERIHPDDPRNNRVEIQISPGFMHNESKSNYSFRDYGSSFSNLTFESRVWFTPLIGVSGKFTFSFAADLSGDKVTQSRIPAHYEFLDLAVNLRNYFGLSRKAKSWELDLLYTDYKLDAPSDNNYRARLKSSGLGLGLKTRLPTSASYAWTLGASFFPRLQHSEEATGAAIQSGGGAESARIGFDVGGEYKFTRFSQVIWSVGMMSEKNLFSGSAGLVDPATGQTPSNVGVTSTFYMFNLGYRWGQ
jgi:hypothetical protein